MRAASGRGKAIVAGRSTRSLGFISDVEASVKKIPIAPLFLALVIMALAVAALDMSGGSVQACDEGKSAALVRSDTRTLLGRVNI